MGVAKNPVTVSGQFKVDAKRLAKLGVLDSTLAIDTRLFIDPLLLRKSTHKEFNDDAVANYRKFFERIIALLAQCESVGDPAWNAAYRLFNFPEVPGTCLGYGAGSIRGSGWGPELRERTLKVALQVVRIGVRDPDLFPAMALFEEKIGPDRLSDMTANISLAALEKFNTRVLRSLGLKGEIFVIRGEPYTFLRNPLEIKATPVILVPTDVLRDLPIARDWDGVKVAAEHNQALRDRVNQHVTELWEAKTKRDKEALKKQALTSKEAFQTVLDTIRAMGDSAYDVARDPLNLVQWARIGREYSERNPIDGPKKVETAAELFRCVQLIIEQFRHLIEDCGLNRELYVAKGRPRHESSAQRIFFSVAYAYCKAFNVDVSPEIDTGNGRIDFKFSKGFKARVLVEIKLSSNPSLVAGFVNQLEVYKQAQETTKAFYLIVDVGRMGQKDKEVVAIRNKRIKDRLPVSDIEFVDGAIYPTASKRK